MSDPEHNGTGKVTRKDFISAQEAAEIVGVGFSTIVDALQHGELRGKNFRGRRGWMTTRPALLRWIESGNQR